MKPLAEELRDLMRASAAPDLPGKAPWDKTLGALAVSSGGSFTPLPLGLDARARVAEAQVVARLRYRVGPVVWLASHAATPVPMTVLAARRSAVRAFASRLRGRPSPVLVDDDAFDAAFEVQAPSSLVARSLLDGPLRAALLGLGSTVRLTYDAGEVTVRWRPPFHDTSTLEAALSALTLARAWRFCDGPYR